MNEILPLSKSDYISAFDLLRENQLPTNDIASNTFLFSIKESNKVVGLVGIEHYGSTALLRSLAVAVEKRGLGLGKKLVYFIENHAKEMGANELVLLTTTATDFFDTLGYKITTREAVPDVIQNSTQFSKTCPTSATVMSKLLN